MVPIFVRDCGIRMNHDQVPRVIVNLLFDLVVAEDLASMKPKGSKYREKAKGFLPRVFAPRVRRMVPILKIKAKNQRSVCEISSVYDHSRT